MSTDAPNLPSWVIPALVVLFAVVAILPILAVLSCLADQFIVAHPFGIDLVPRTN